RRVLGPESERLQSPTSRTLRFDLAGADCDVYAFDLAARKEDLACLHDAIALFRGPLLEDCLEDWAMPERESREQAYLHMLEVLADHAAEARDNVETARLLRLAIAVDPFRESVVCRLMKALAAIGDHAAVTQVYRDFRLRLHEELRTEPNAHTAALYHRLRED